ncbi:unnamed protein product [Polarella glacialis]|uniref:Subtilisin n=1 Tax=Polarella glacialis TaxID=89957 RepID=A0A813EC72_POLGL|nr:unnamed protein product [Polarella glacialis]
MAGWKALALWASAVVSTSSADVPTALVPRELLDALRPRVDALHASVKLVAFEDASQDDISAASAIAPSFSLNSTALSELLGKMPSGKLLQWIATGTDLLNFTAVPSRFAICNVHQAGVAISEFVIAAVPAFSIHR